MSHPGAPPAKDDSATDPRSAAALDPALAAVADSVGELIVTPARQRPGESPATRDGR